MSNLIYLYNQIFKSEGFYAVLRVINVVPSLRKSFTMRCLTRLYSTLAQEREETCPESKRCHFPACQDSLHPPLP